MIAHVFDFRERQFQRDVEKLVALGPRVVGELLAELGASRLISNGD